MRKAGRKLEAELAKIGEKQQQEREEEESAHSKLDDKGKTLWEKAVGARLHMYRAPVKGYP